MEICESYDEELEPHRVFLEETCVSYGLELELHTVFLEEICASYDVELEFYRAFLVEISVSYNLEQELHIVFLVETCVSCDEKVLKVLVVNILFLKVSQKSLDFKENILINFMSVSEKIFL